MIILPIEASQHDRSVPLVGSGAAEMVCGLERTREGATMGNFIFFLLNNPMRIFRYVASSKNLHYPSSTIIHP